MESVVYLVEIAVGVVCAAGGIALARRAGPPRRVGAIIVVAGVVAVAHALLQLSA